MDKGLIVYYVYLIKKKTCNKIIPFQLSNTINESQALRHKAQAQSSERNLPHTIILWTSFEGTILINDKMISKFQFSEFTMMNYQKSSRYTRTRCNINHHASFYSKGIYAPKIFKNDLHHKKAYKILPHRTPFKVL